MFDASLLKRPAVQRGSPGLDDQLVGARHARGVADWIAYGLYQASGEVLSASVSAVEVSDTLGLLEIGTRVRIGEGAGAPIAEVVALKDRAAICLPFGVVAGVRRGACVTFLKEGPALRPGDDWLGRVINGFAGPLDDKGPIVPGREKRPLRAAPPPAAARARLGGALETGIKAIDLFTPCKKGQRMGLFSAAGVGKSMLLSMLARNVTCDVIVIALIGERGREVREFMEDSLGPEGMKRAVLVVSTADEPALMRREAAFAAMSIAEHFRDQGKHVLCLFDSLTRLAQAQREIGLSGGEPPTSRGYPPSVFSLLPQLLERAGPGPKGQAGTITAMFTVLVEGDDHDEPISDASRSILDGHIVLSRAIAESGRYPAIDVLKSVSRTATPLMPVSGVTGSDGSAPDDVVSDNNGIETTPTNSAKHQQVVREARQLFSAYEEMRDMIRVGAYRVGADPTVDRAVSFVGRVEAFLTQMPHDRVSSGEALAELAMLLDANETAATELDKR
ncbi:MAG: FliI/YscN family ATPase [Pseudomonadota bacterium]